MWLIATGMVDVTKPRAAPDIANRIIPLGLILSVPVAVFDKGRGFARFFPDGLGILAVGVGLSAIVLGLSARRALGQAYTPRGAAQEKTQMVRQGPYLWIRHPLYLAAILWSIGWPLLLKSLLGCLAALAFILPAVLIRIQGEEEALLRVLGEESEAGNTDAVGSVAKIEKIQAGDCIDRGAGRGRIIGKRTAYASTRHEERPGKPLPGPGSHIHNVLNALRYGVIAPSAARKPLAALVGQKDGISTSGERKRQWDE